MNATGIVLSIVGIVVAIIGTQIIGDVLSTEINSKQASYTAFTGFIPIIRLLPLAIIGGVIYMAVKSFRGGGNN